MSKIEREIKYAMNRKNCDMMLCRAFGRAMRDGNVAYVRVASDEAGNTGFRGVYGTYGREIEAYTSWDAAKKVSDTASFKPYTYRELFQELRELDIDGVIFNPLLTEYGIEALEITMEFVDYITEWGEVIA